MNVIAPLDLLRPTEATHTAGDPSVFGPQLFTRLLHRDNTPEKLRQLLARPSAFGYEKASKSLYIYQINTPRQKTLGILCQLSDTSKVTTHEQVLPQRVSIFARYLAHSKLQAEPIVVAHENKQLHESIVHYCIEEPKTHTYKIGDNHYSLWKVKEAFGKYIVRETEHEKYLHLMDGHHRLASFLQAKQAHLWSSGVLSFLVFQKALHCEAFSWGLSHTPKEWDKQLSAMHLKRNQSADIFVNYKQKQYHISCPKSYNPASYIVDVLLQTEPPSRDAITYFPPHTKLIDNETYPGFITFRPLRWEEIKTAAINQKNLPPKSTYFTPKLPCGLFLYPIF